MRACRDWQENAEDADLLDIFEANLPDHLWMVEVSIPELFPANYRKLGELILDARMSVDPDRPHGLLWMIARLPSLYLVNLSPAEGPTKFVPLTSLLNSHTPLYCGLNANGER